MADEELFSGFPSAPAPPDRYGVPVEYRRWSLLEDLAIWPVIVDRESPQEYAHASRWFCQTLNRMPHCKDHEILKQCPDHLEMRYVTRHLEGQVHGLVATARELFGSYRQGIPWTWVERTWMLKPWYKKQAKHSRIKLTDLLILMGRDQRDEVYANDYLRVLKVGGEDRETKENPIMDSTTSARLLQRAVVTSSPSLWREFLCSCRGM